MKNLIMKTTAMALSFMLIIISLSACSQSNSEYDYLKDEIVGVWMDEGGPSVDSDSPIGKSLVFYEFTTDGLIYYHYINSSLQEGTISDGTIEGGKYHIEDNMFVFDEDDTGAIISIDGDTLTMSNNSGDTKYTRVSMADAVGYSIYCKDPVLLREQNVILYGEEYVSQSESESISQSISESEAALTASETEETEENTETASAESTEETTTAGETESESVSE